MATIIRVKAARTPRAGKETSRCEVCNTEITRGTPYKHISKKVSPYSIVKYVRCDRCPDWKSWELSTALWAQLARIEYDFGNTLNGVESEDDVTDALSYAASEVREIAEAKRESASNIEDGFGHPTSVSEGLESVADDLDAWADDIENADVPSFPEPEEADCEDCNGEPHNHECEVCYGKGCYTPDEPTGDQIDEWRGELPDALSIVSESPV